MTTGAAPLTTTRSRGSCAPWTRRRSSRRGGSAGATSRQTQPTPTARGRPTDDDRRLRKRRGPHRREPEAADTPSAVPATSQLHCLPDARLPPAVAPFDGSNGLGLGSDGAFLASFNRVLRAAIALSSVQRLLTLCGSSPSCGRVTAVGVARARRARICLTRLSTRTWASCETCPAVRARSVRLSLRAMTAPPLPALDRVAANGGRCQRRSASLLDALSDRAVDAAPRSCARRAEARAQRRCPALAGTISASEIASRRPCATAMAVAGGLVGVVG